MSFIRAKEIPPGSGNWYDYEVKSVWKNGTCRQEIIRYVGRSGKSTIVRAKGIPNTEYKVTLHERRSTKKRVIDATLTPIPVSE